MEWTDCGLIRSTEVTKQRSLGEAENGNGCEVFEGFYEPSGNDKYTADLTVELTCATKAAGGRCIRRAVSCPLKLAIFVLLTTGLNY